MPVRIRAMKRILICAAILLMAGTVSAGAGARAAERGDRSGDGKDEHLVVRTYTRSPATVKISLVEDPERPGEPALRVASPLVLSTCAHLSPLSFHTEVDREHYDVFIGTYQVSHIQGRPELCARGNQAVEALVPLRPQEWREEGITAIRLWKGSMMDSFRIVRGEGRLQLVSYGKPRYFEPDFAAGLDPLSYYAEGSGRVDLVVYGSPRSDVTRAVMELARGRGLEDGKPVGDTQDYADAGEAVTAMPRFSFRDPGGRYAKELRYADKVHVGTIRVPVDPAGPFRKYGREMPMDVFAVRPQYY